MQEMLFRANVVRDNGQTRLRFAHGKWYRTQMLKWKDGDGVFVHVTDAKPTRSAAQNAYWWAYMTEIAHRTGHAPEEIHEWAKDKYLPKRISTVFGKETVIGGSTARLNVTEFSALIESVERDTGITMPPLENYFAN